jgi:hypothetical protein
MSSFMLGSNDKKTPLAIVLLKGLSQEMELAFDDMYF